MKNKMIVQFFLYDDEEIVSDIFASLVNVEFGEFNICYVWESYVDSIDEIVIKMGSGIYKATRAFRFNDNHITKYHICEWEIINEKEN